MSTHHEALDSPPPWIVFPDIQAEAFAQYLKQGATEVWYDTVWAPFWSSLNEPQQAQYLDRWNTSDAWKLALENLNALSANFDVALDARESEAYMREWKAAQAKKPSFLKRIFGRS